MFLGYPNHSLLISSPAAICQSCRDTSPTGGKWYSFSGSAWLADGSQGPSPHVDQCGKPNKKHLYWGWCINYILGLPQATYRHIPTCSESFRWCVSGWKKSKVAPDFFLATRTSNISIHLKGPSDTPDVIQAQKIIGGNLPIHESFINLP